LVYFGFFFAEKNVLEMYNIYNEQTNEMYNIYKTRSELPSLLLKAVA